MNQTEIEQARFNMIEQQIRTWDVLDQRVLDVMNSIPREQFVPENCRSLAFADTNIPLGHEQVMMAPKLEGRLLQALAIKPDDSVLEIGTGSGYLTACLAALAQHVTSIDIYDDFLEAAATRLADTRISNVELLQMNAMESLPKQEFDAIAVTGSLQSFDPRFVDALAPHGKLFVVVGDAPAMEAKLVERTEQNDWQTVSLFETSLAPLVDGALPPRFSF